MDHQVATSGGATELRDYLGALRRRIGVIAVIAASLTIAAVIVAFLIKPLYMSQAMISIESQEIPESIVATTVTGYVTERITGLKNRLLTPERLWSIAQKINLFPDIAKKYGPGAVVSQMEDGIEVAPVDIKFARPGTGQTGIATVAFTISFLADTADKAQQGADMLANLFIEEEQRSRTKQSADVTRFLTEQAGMLRAHISELEAKLSKFKQKNVPSLPEFVNLNMRLMEQTNEKVANTEERIRALRERRVFLESQLATTDKYAPIVGSDGQPVLAPGQRLKLLRTEYLRLSATYSPDHPDIIRLRREMDVLESESGVAPEAVKLIKEREKLRAQLTEMKQRYSDEYPDVLRLKSSIAKLEASIANAPIASAPAPQEQGAPPDNPPYIKLKTELDALDVNLKSEQDQLARLNEKRNELEKRLFNSPQVEKEYLDLSRDYQNTVKRYQETNDKLLSAKAAQRLETENKSQRFLLLRNANYPSKPAKPNRLAIVLVGFFLGMTGGISVASISEYLDQTVRGVRGVINVFGAPPIATIPYIDNPGDVKRRRLRNTGILVAIPLCILIAVVLLDTLWKPIDEWWPSEPAVTTQAGDVGNPTPAVNQPVPAGQPAAANQPPVDGQ